MAKKIVKKRNRLAQDATLINVRPLKARLKRIEKFLTEQFGGLFSKGGRDPDLYA